MSACGKNVLIVFCSLLAQYACAGSGVMALGGDASKGSYGNPISTYVYSQVLSVRYEEGRQTFRFDLPYLQVNGPASLVLDAEGSVVTTGADTRRRRIEGMGDAVLGFSQYVWESEDRQWWLDLGGKLKLPTASHRNGLGTGKADISLQAELYRQFGHWGVFSGVAHKWVGRPSGSDYRNASSALFGLSAPIGGLHSLGAVFDYRQSAWVGLPAQRELTLFLNYHLAPKLQLQSYIYGGASRTSPDLGGGLVLRQSF